MPSTFSYCWDISHCRVAEATLLNVSTSVPDRWAMFFRNNYIHAGLHVQRFHPVFVSTVFINQAALYSQQYSKNVSYWKAKLYSLMEPRLIFRELNSLTFRMQHPKTICANMLSNFIQLILRIILNFTRTKQWCYANLIELFTPQLQWMRFFIQDPCKLTSILSTQISGLRLTYYITILFSKANLSATVRAGNNTTRSVLVTAQWTCNAFKLS